MNQPTLPQPCDETPEDPGVLIARCLTGDQVAYAHMYDRYAAGTYRLCYSLLLNKQDAEDVVQDSFVYAFKNLRRYDSQKASFKTWLYTIAVSRCRNMYRRKHGWFTLDLSAILNLNLHAPHTETPEAAFAQRTASDAITDALRDLSPRLREALALRYGQGLTYREIADIMGCPPKTAESRVRLAHEQLRSRLQTDGRGLLEELLQL